ncbi:MAG: SurA N-terminal domain-containing protein [Bradymonadia bacterium]
MLTDLREKSQNFLVYILFGILIFVFIFFFGPQADGFQPNAPTPRALTGWAANVNGEDVTVQEVNLAVFRDKAYNRAFPDDSDGIAQLSRAAARQVAEQTILAQQARKMGISVSNEELTKFILSDQNERDIGFFRDRDGKIRVDELRTILSGSLGTSPEVYRKAKRRELLVRRYMDFLVASVKVSEAEVKEEFDRANRSWNLEYVSVDPATLRADVPTPNAEAVAAYRKANEADVKSYYDANVSEYKRDKEVRVSRVLIRKPKDKKDTAGIAKAKEKAAALLEKAKAEGADFGAIAKESSEGWFKTRGTGGDMGWQNSKRPGYDVFKALAKGQVSDLQEDQGWFYFVKATDIKPALDKSLDSVADEIASSLIVEAAAKKIAKTNAEAIYQKAVKTGELKAQSKKADEAVADGTATTTADAPENEQAMPKVVEDPLQTTGPVKENRRDWSQIPGIGKSDAVAGALAGLTKDAPLIKQVVEAEGKFYVVRLKERTEPKAEDFAKEKQSLKGRLLAGRAFELFGTWNELLFGLPSNRQRATRGAMTKDLFAGSKVDFNDAVFPIKGKPATPQP